jgi:hypothetical protein
MAQREMSGKALLDKLYSGLDTMPAVEAEMDASDLRRLNDELLGKPPEPTAPVRHPAAASRVASNARPAARMGILRLSLLVLLPVAAVGMIAAGALRESDKRAALPPPPPAVVPVPVPPPSVQAAESPPPQPVVLVNPFDATEKFTFPPGTSKADARDQMAALLLERATQRGAHLPRVPRARKLAAEPKPRSTGHGS